MILYIEIRKLKRQIAEMQAKFSKVNQEKATLTRENKRLYGEN